MSYEFVAAGGTCRLSSTCYAESQHQDQPGTTLVIKQQAIDANPFGGFWHIDYETACNGANDIAYNLQSFEDCELGCRNNPACVSFEYGEADYQNGIASCTQSTTCLGLGSADVAYYNGWDLYSKLTALDQRDGTSTAVPPTWSVKTGHACTNLDELGVTTGVALSTCRFLCWQEATCTSFEHKQSDLTCRQSTTCIEGVNEVATADFDLYTKTSAMV
jgi:hypothetical protein